MSATLLYFLLPVVALAGAAAGYLAAKQQARSRLQSVQSLSRKILEEARLEAEHQKKDALLQAKDQILQMKTDFETEIREHRNEMLQQEKRLALRDESLTKRAEVLEQREIDCARREQSLLDRERNISDAKASYDKLLKEGREQLEQIAQMNQEEGRAYLLNSLENDIRHEGARLIRRLEQETKEQAAKKVQEILGLACKRYAGDYAVERTVSVVSLPNDEMKGRIIGREGRNIRAIEAAAGVDLIIDDTPEAVVVSSFNPIRREIARLSLERLIGDGRIHPARIEEVVKKVALEVDASIKEAGEQAVFDLGVHGIHPELIKLIGRLRYRSSYSQNVWQHSMEVAYLCGIMAGELGINPKQARRVGLLHDIGKAMDHEIEGSHAVIGAELAKRYGEKPHIVHAIHAHHEEITPDGILDVLVQAADALSGARPGARREMLESYVKRLEELENIATSFDGVANAFAIQAGREVRIMLEAEKTNDGQAVWLSREVARKIEQDMTYPGQIRVTVIRETRAVEYAK
ncbi:MAG: ribonuclease Y [Desulfarculales bacterium]|jgi:ribonuclease Y|nr:ribonuclease Y [Desulfarculales bacterium]